MPKVVIITGPGFQDHDVVYTYYRAKEEGRGRQHTRNQPPLHAGGYGSALSSVAPKSASTRPAPPS